MSQLLRTAEAYYEVARDLDFDIQEKTRIRDFLNRRGDELCEANVRIEAEREKATAIKSSDAAVCIHCGRHPFKDAERGEFRECTNALTGHQIAEPSPNVPVQAECRVCGHRHDPNVHCFDAFKGAP